MSQRADDARKFQLQRDAWRSLAVEMVKFLADGLDERTGYSATQADVIAAWQRRIRILDRRPRAVEGTP